MDDWLYVWVFLVLFMPVLRPHNYMTNQVELGAEIKCETHSFVLMQGLSLPLEQDGVFSKLLDVFPKQNTTLPTFWGYSCISIVHISVAS